MPTSTAPAQPNPNLDAGAMGQSPYSTLVLIALMVVAFYFLIIRPNKKRQLAQQATMNSLTIGTRVLTTSGVFGNIVEIGAKQAVLEISPGAHLTVLKQAIARAVRDGDEDTEWESDEDDDLADLEAEPTATDHTIPGPTTSTGTLSSTTSSAGTTSPEPTSGSNPWTNEGSHSYGSDQDPRSGTNTTPIKD
jgi:preprotein translocase subunit YajC